mmetsp:Transcript_13976/g.48249  ORF Transcript_13976/g.48249 Transcript_13976/m.48249 type:complete len:210 (-) Transcript_13976:76-705(-)
MNAHDQIMAVVSTMSIEQMYNVMGQLKTICAQNREQARELFNTYPQLSMAVLRMHDLLSKYSSGGPPPPVGIHSDPLPRGGMSGLSGPGMPPPPQLGGGMGMPGNVPPSAMGQPVGGASVTSGRGGSGDSSYPGSSAGGGYGMTPGGSGAMGLGPGGGNLQQMLANLTPEQRQQFNTLMSLPPEQLAAMPDSVKQQVMALRQLRGSLPL